MVVGATIDSSGPRNHFPLEPTTPALLVAGGIGITPMIAMAHQLQTEQRPWRLVYLGRRRESMAYVEDLIAEFGDHVEVHVTSEEGHFDIGRDIANLPGETHVYCCGPESLMEAVEEALAADPERAHLERFRPRGFVSEAPDEEFVVYATASDVEFVVPQDESILMAADFEGIVVPGDCLEGTCGSCETRVLLGQIEHRDSVLSPAARAESKTMMICVSRAAHGCDRIELDL
jgi:ferredoxin-NADP reductase